MVKAAVSLGAAAAAHPGAHRTQGGSSEKLGKHRWVVERTMAWLAHCRRRIKKELAAFDVKEERLLDLAADGSLTTDKVRDRLSKLQVQRATLTQRLATTEDYVREESATILSYLDLLEQPGAFYAAAHDNVKRKLLAA